MLCIPVGGLHHLALCLDFSLAVLDIFLAATELFAICIYFSTIPLAVVDPGFCVISISIHLQYLGIALSFDWPDFELIYLVVSHIVVGLCFLTELELISWKLSIL